MNNTKQAIIVRKDLGLRREKFAALIARASMKFIIDNNEAERKDELYVRLSNEEVNWLESSLPVIFTVDSQLDLENLIFQAKMAGVNVHSIFSNADSKIEEKTILCTAIGPDDSEVINQLTKGLKSF